MNKNKVAIYIRLSDADEDTGKNKDESDSIINQRGLINNYLDSSPDLAKLPRQEFADDGYSGKNTNRPGFQRMIEMIKNGEFSVCITKDFSRFSRDYLEMGDYLDCLFPFLRVRYISINDNYDSDDYKGTTGGIDVAMRTFIYDSYSRDLSDKVKSGQLLSARKGRRVHGLPGYGYMMDPNNKAMDIIDPETSVIVRRIFDKAIEGKSTKEIAEMLNKDGIPTPLQHYRKKHPKSTKYKNASDLLAWKSVTVRQILERYTYTGASVQNKRYVVNPCQRKTKNKPRDEWVVVLGMHEAIVTVEEFNEAQKAIVRRKGVKRVEKDYPLKSMMFCNFCGRRLERSKCKIKSNFFYCRFGSDYGNDNCCKIRSPREDVLNKIVYDAIIRMIKRAKKGIPDTVTIKRFLDKEKDAAEKCRNTIETHKWEIINTYEKYALDKISKEEFQKKKESIESKIERIEKELAEHEAKIDKENSISESELQSRCNMFSGAGELTGEMVKAFIEKIIVYPENEIEIKWKFRDCIKQDF